MTVVSTKAVLPRICRHHICRVELLSAMPGTEELDRGLAICSHVNFELFCRVIDLTLESGSCQFRAGLSKRGTDIVEDHVGMHI